MENNFKKTDLWSALFIGIVCAILMIIIAGNLAMENPAINAAMPYINYLLVVFPILCVLGIIISYFLSKIMPVIHQVAKFILVGGMNFLVDMGILNFFIFYTGISAGLTQSGFKGISFSIAIVNSYFWNKHWTFQRKTEEGLAREFLQFLAVSLVGFLINLGVDYAFVNIISPFGGMLAKTWAQFGALMASIVALFWNFLGYKFFVFDFKKETVSQTTT